MMFVMKVMVYRHIDDNYVIYGYNVKNSVTEQKPKGRVIEDE